MNPVGPQVGAAAACAVAGAGAVPWLVRRGMAALRETDPGEAGGRVVEDVAPARAGAVATGAAAGAVTGAAAVLVAVRAGSWWLLPALLAWAFGLAGAACCDAFTQRVPTLLVRQGAAYTAALLVVAAALSRDWAALLRAGLAALVAGAAVLLLWRFAGAGYGDVRLAFLGGLGLGHLRAAGAPLGLAGFVLITLGQVVVVLLRGGDRRSMLPFGPALAAAFVLAAVG